MHSGKREEHVELEYEMFRVLLDAKLGDLAPSDAKLLPLLVDCRA